MPNITYTLVGDYYLPNIILSDPPDAEPLTRYGMMRKNFLKEHRPISYGQMLLQEKLYPHCRDIQRQAHERLDTLMAHFMSNNPPPDKATNNLAWASHMDMLRHTAVEIVLSELIYS
ncbi:MAG: TnpV protein [Defluviitaleaceae bacterium]|nr:TnpV protein [Defluviitaleaceae bacterium]